MYIAVISLSVKHQCLLPRQQIYDKTQKHTQTVNGVIEELIEE